MLSSVAVNVFLASVKVILNLWAPGAFTFDVPCALSFRVVSSLGVTKLSVTDKPILYEGEFVYLSNTKTELSTLTWNPLI